MRLIKTIYVIVVWQGHGEVGRRITKTLMDDGIKVVIAEENREIVENLREKGIAAVSGRATEPSVLIQAHIQTCAPIGHFTDGHCRYS